LLPKVDADPNTEVPKGRVVEVFVNDPDPNSDYTWSNGFEGAIQKVKILGDTTFVVTVTDENGCTGTDEISLKIRLPICEQDVFIPTAFSPNGDDVNNELFVRSNYITTMELIIYNRWGQQVFNTKDINRGWDGKLNGEELSPDTYAYWLTAKCTDGEAITKRGSISLLR
jgi:gliding motility-associated-like protein